MSTAVVTGASSGIGEATARRLDADGWRVLLVARRQERLEALAQELRAASVLALDLTDDSTPRLVAEWVDQNFYQLKLLVNNAGADGHESFAAGGFASVKGAMAVNFEAAVRLTEGLLPVLRRSAPSAIVNVSSVAGRIGMAHSGAYGASKFALAGWTEALALEEGEHGVHVGLVLPGFVATEGFPQRELRASVKTRWVVSRPERVAAAVLQVGPGGKHERYVPRPYALVPVVRALCPPLWRAIARRLPG